MPGSLRLDQTAYTEAKLIRVLLGTADISCDYDAFVFQPRHDYSRSGGIPNSAISSRTLKNLLIPIGHASLVKYLAKAGNTNHLFCQNLLTEFCFFLYQTRKGCHTAAFAHVYRTLELVSYTFPLVYAATSTNFLKSYDALRSYFAGDGKQGELKFLQRFVEVVFDGDPILNTSTDLDVTALDNVTRDKIYESLKKVLAEVKNVTSDDNLKRVTVPNRRMIEAIYVIRNRFFHFATGGHQENIKSLEIVHPDAFFENFNKQAATWIVMIYFKNLEELCDRWG